MKYAALATDYDGTIAYEGEVAPATVEALRRARSAGLRLVLVTGRELAELFNTFTDADVFDLIVGENGAVLFDPATRQLIPLADPPPTALVEALTNANVPLSTGHSIVATVMPYHEHLYSAVRDLAPSWHVIPNKESFMALPAGVSKATGLLHALDRLRVDRQRTVAVGDAENDEALLRACGLRVAVANALPMLKEIAHVVTTGARGDGVIELIEGLLAGSFDGGGADVSEPSAADPRP